MEPQSMTDSNLFLGIDYSPAKNVRISPNFIGFFPDDSRSRLRGNSRDESGGEVLSRVV